MGASCAIPETASENQRQPLNAVMEELAKLLTAIAYLAWPGIAAFALFKLYGPISDFVRSAARRKFTIKVGGYELTVDEASEQQRLIIADLQERLVELEKRFAAKRADSSAGDIQTPNFKGQFLWVDDNPKNNSYLVAGLEERGARVDIALSTEEAMAKLDRRNYDAVISDMARPEGDQAGLDLTRKIKAHYPKIPVFIYCGAWAAQNLRNEALNAGATDITTSGTTLLTALQMQSPDD